MKNKSLPYIIGGVLMAALVVVAVVLGTGKQFQGYLSLPGSTPKISSTPIVSLPPSPKTFHISGHVVSVNNLGKLLLNAGIKEGSPVKGTYTYDANTANTSSDLTTGSYISKGPSYGMEVLINNWTFKTDPVNGGLDYHIYTNKNGEYPNHLLIFSWGNSITIPDLGFNNTNSDETIGWTLYDSSGMAVSSRALPQGCPDLKKFTNNILNMDYKNLNTQEHFKIQAVIDSCTP